MPKTSTDWTALTPPGLDVFEQMAQAAFDALPAHFRQLTGDVLFAVADFPEDDMLDDLGLESPFDLLGLFEGAGMTEMGDTPQTGTLPNRVYLFRRPILDFWAEEEDETLGDIVTHVLVHEIGHHFGYSDEDMEAIEAEAARDEG
ncbi:MAG: metallopeptidase family protein [Alphaproteobacteria bacterium]|nr:metallopeptidase family protein [Alphaproteobacteria bacterium]